MGLTVWREHILWNRPYIKENTFCCSSQRRTYFPTHLQKRPANTELIVYREHILLTRTDSIANHWWPWSLLKTLRRWPWSLLHILHHSSPCILLLDSFVRETRAHTHTHTLSLNHAHTLSHTLSHTHTHTHPHTHSITHTLSHIHRNPCTHHYKRALRTQGWFTLSHTQTHKNSHTYTCTYTHTKIPLTHPCKKALRIFVHLVLLKCEEPWHIAPKKPYEPTPNSRTHP